MTNSKLFRRSTARSARRRRGFTLLEILTSITLGLMLMYAVARIFSQVGGAMNETMSTMEMANALRNAKNRLTTDLEALSVTPAPPRNSRRDEGYLCYVEGMGGPFSRVYQNLKSVTRNGITSNVAVPFSTGDVALDLERYQSNADPSDSPDYSDSTVGDLDDILSFTAKAPEGQPFKGRFIQPVYEVNNSGARVLVDGIESTVEAEYAEIVWFVRGTTLYRRVLPLVSNRILQESFNALVAASNNANSNLNGINAGNIRQGFGFYRFYDVSVHLGSGGTLVANTLGDLTNRENRYFYWNSCGKHLHPDNSALDPIVAYGLHGNSGAWYWLRMATLQESAAPNFRAGAPFGQNSFARDSLNGAGSLGARSLMIGDVSGAVADWWLGWNQTLNATLDAGASSLDAGTYSAADLPVAASPFIDFWGSPNVWDETNVETGDLSLNAGDFNANNAGNVLTFNQDVVLTNVLSFNVRAWDPNTNAYVDLGSGVANGDSNFSDSADLRSYGYYANAAKSPWIPCVYDTWSEQYQRDFCAYNEQKSAAEATGTTSQIPLDGEVASAELPDYPPPYDVRLKSLQIEIRVFDPRSKNLRNATFNVDFSGI